MVERAALEMRCTGNCTGGSNPSLSAKTNRAAGYGTYHKGNLQVILKLPLHFKEFPQGTYLPATALPRENEPGKLSPIPPNDIGTCRRLPFGCGKGGPFPRIPRLLLSGRRSTENEAPQQRPGPVPDCRKTTSCHRNPLSDGNGLSY